jgi:hypothetical protein
MTTARATTKPPDPSTVAGDRTTTLPQFALTIVTITKSPTADRRLLIQAELAPHLPIQTEVAPPLAPFRPFPRVRLPAKVRTRTEVLFSVATGANQSSRLPTIEGKRAGVRPGSRSCWWLT